MKFKFRSMAVVLSIFILSLSLMVGCGVKETNNDTEPQKDAENTQQDLEEIDITLMASPQGGAWYPLAVAIGELIKGEVPGSNITIGPGGGASNLVAVDNGEAEFGFTASCTATDAINGVEPFKEKMANFRHIVSLYPHYNQWVVMDDSDIKSISDLKGKSISVMPKGWAAEALNKQTFEALGMGYEDFSRVEFLGYQETVELMKDGRLDAGLFQATLPHSALVDLATARKIRFLEFDDETYNKLVKINSGISQTVIKSGSYENIDEDVKTIESPLILFVSKDVSDELAYKITKIIVENVEELAGVTQAMKGITPEYMTQDVGIELHPGALRYYKEKGFR